MYHFDGICHVSSSASKIAAVVAERDVAHALGQERAANIGRAIHRRFRNSCKGRGAVFCNEKAIVAVPGVESLMLARNVVRVHFIGGGHDTCGAGSRPRCAPRPAP